MAKRVFVHRYRWSHSRIRKKYRRLYSQDKVTLLRQTRDGWLYLHKPKVTGEERENLKR